jgi:two-component system, OmpR family, phosphate regulon sensor histidine kinase PhoR
MVRFEDTATAGLHQKSMDLQRTSDFQAALLGMAGHDLRQPLQIIQCAYEWLGSRMSTAPDLIRLKRGERALARLNEQLDNLVGALRMTEAAGHIDMVAVAVAPLMQRIAVENDEAVEKKGVELRVCATSAKVLSNPVLLEGILRNLVRNAIKFTEPGGRILVGCRRSGADILIDVCDTGIGIAPDQVPRIFEAFRRIDTTRADGLGIGLFVVRRAVDLLGHSISVTSTVRRGSRFSVRARAAD